MATTVAATLSGADGTVYTIAEPARSVTYFPSIPPQTVASAPGLIGSINGAVANGTLLPVRYDPAGIPTVAAGQTGYLVDTLAGAAVTLPAGYGTFLENGGAATVTTDPTRAQAVIAQSAGLVLNAIGGSGTVLAAGGDGTFALAGAVETVFASGAGNVVYASGGDVDVTLNDPGNSVALDGGTGGVSGVGADAIGVGAGDYSIYEQAGAVIQLGSGTATVNAAGGTVIGGSGNTFVQASAKEVVSVGAGAMLIDSSVNAGVRVVNGTGAVVFTSSNFSIGYLPDGSQYGQDVVLGGAGSVTVNGGENVSDGPSSFAGDLFVGGTAGHNVITALGAFDAVYGGGDGDLLSVAYGGGSALIVAGAGSETITALGSAGDTLVGGSGSDLIFGGFSDRILAGSGSATIIAAISQRPFSSTQDTAYSLVRLGAGNALVQLQGAVTVGTQFMGVSGQSYSDTLLAGAGSATVAADHGALVFGGTGALLYFGGDSASTLIGGSGSVTALGGQGGGLFFGGASGGNVLETGAQSTTLVGAAGDLLFATGSAADVLAAGGGVEILDGSRGSGANVFFAGSGTDCVIGGGGNDAVVAGRGDATLAGGGGGNLFVFTNGAAGGVDVIADFDATRDFVKLSGYAPNEAARALANATVSGGSTTLALSDGTEVTFAGIVQLASASFA